MLINQTQQQQVSRRRARAVLLAMFCHCQSPLSSATPMSLSGNSELDLAVEAVTEAAAHKVLTTPLSSNKCPEAAQQLPEADVK